MRRPIRHLPHDVYRVRDAAGALLYVGCSLDAFNRVRQHKYECQPWFPSAVTVDVEQYRDLLTARYVEARAIATEAPIWNTAKEWAALHRGDYMNLAPVIMDKFTGIPIAEVWMVAA